MMTRQSAEILGGKANFLEKRLAGLLKPVAPRREFVRGLGHRIQSVTQPAIVNRLASLEFWLIFLAGLVSFGLLIALMVRTLTMLFGRKRPGTVSSRA